MSSLSKIGENGECTSCKKSAGNAYVVCFFCKDSFHAVNCSAPTSICNSSFHQLFKPLTEKIGVNASRPGKFLWACDICLTNHEIDQVSTDNNKIEKLQAQVHTLAQGMEDIKNMLSCKSSGPLVTERHSNVKLPSGNINSCSSNVWSNDNLKNDKINSNSSFEYPLESNNEKSVGISSTDNSNVKTTSVLVIDKFDNEMDEKENMNKIEDVIVKQKVDIENSYKNQSGKTVIVCKSSEQRDSLKSKISSVIPNLSVKAVGNLNKTLVVAGFNGNYTEENIIDTLLDHNNYITNYIEFKSSTAENHLSLLTVKPLKNDPSLSQVILKVSSGLRELILKNGDKVRIGMKRCPVYERFFVKRCFGCQHFGHFHAQCPTKNMFCCAKCAGEHETHKCEASSSAHKCVNCKRAGRNEGINHTASSLYCPVFAKELEKLKKNAKN